MQKCKNSNILPDWCVLTRTDSLYIKGAAILLMIYHHIFLEYPKAVGAFFGIDNRVLNELPILAGSCVALFAFCTGYAFALSAQKDDGSNLLHVGFLRAKKFYKIYIFAFALVALVSFLVPESGMFHRLSFAEIFFGIFGYCPNATVCDWWYASLFFFSCIVIYPLFLGALRICGAKFWGHFFVIFVLGIAVMAVWFYAKAAYESEPANAHFEVFLDLIVNVFSFLPFLLLGATVRFLWASKSFMQVVANVAALLFVVYLCTLLKWRDITIFAIAAIVCCVIVARMLPAIVGRVLALFGVYSAFMWLNHRMIFGYWFKDFFAQMGNPIAEYALVVGLSLALAVLLTFMLSKVEAGISFFVAKNKDANHGNNMA